MRSPAIDRACIEWMERLTPEWQPRPDGLTDAEETAIGRLMARFFVQARAIAETADGKKRFTLITSGNFQTSIRASLRENANVRIVDLRLSTTGADDKDRLLQIPDRVIRNQMFLDDVNAKISVTPPPIPARIEKTELIGRTDTQPTSDVVIAQPRAGLSPASITPTEPQLISDAAVAWIPISEAMRLAGVTEPKSIWRHAVGRGYRCRGQGKDREVEKAGFDKWLANKKPRTQVQATTQPRYQCEARADHPPQHTFGNCKVCGGTTRFIPSPQNKPKAGR